MFLSPRRRGDFYGIPARFDDSTWCCRGFCEKFIGQRRKERIFGKVGFIPFSQISSFRSLLISTLAHWIGQVREYYIYRNSGCSRESRIYLSGNLGKYIFARDSDSFYSAFSPSRFDPNRS